MKIKHAFLLQATLIALLVACGAPAPAPTPIPPTPTLPPPPTATASAASVRYHYVTSSLLVPTTQDQADSFALNIDGDPQNQPDNLFGRLLILLNSISPDLKLQATIDDAVNSGQIVTLHSLQTGDSASWHVFLGQPVTTAPHFDGTDQFTLNPNAPTNTVLTGTLVNGHFAGGPGEVRAQLSFLGTPVDVGLVGVRLEADVSDKGCINGKLGGGITVSEFRAKLLPAMSDGLNRIIAAEPADSKLRTTLLTTLDANSDGSISADELENNLILKLATSPDLDLLDASGKFNPRQDGVKDSMSVGLGFSCAPAIFTAPGE